MTEVSFKSTFRIPVSQQGINAAKKGKLKKLIGQYPNSMVGTGNTGYARISIANSEDATFIRKLKEIGYKIYQIFEGENLDKKSMDKYIKEALTTGEYGQKGKQMAAKKQRPLARAGRPEQHEVLEKSHKLKQDVNYKKPLQSESLKKPKVRYEICASKEEMNEICTSADYKRIAVENGKEFADMVFFGTRIK